MVNQLEKYFSYRIEKLANSFGYVVTIWNEFGLSCASHGDTVDEAIMKAMKLYSEGKVQ
jgi:predicted RNase H-like HicB family nuclease